MSSEPRDYLRHILAEAEYLLATRSGLTYEAFVRCRENSDPGTRQWSGGQWPECETA